MKKTVRSFNRICLLILGAGLIFFPVVCSAQQQILIHSHNDYERRVPFYQAYAQQVASIEVDLYAIGEAHELRVADDLKGVDAAPAFDELYIQPLVSLFKQNKGRPWKNSDRTLTLLIDLKTPAHPTLDRIVAKLNVYPEVFDPAINPYAVRVVISGNRPDENSYDKYPLYLSFDGYKTSYTPEQLKRIAMISLSFRDYSQWNGKGTLIKSELDKVMKVIQEVHALGKPIRFWGTPDGVTAWNTFHNIGVDYINTDRPEACADYFARFENKNYQIGRNEVLSGEVAQAKKLDKTTVGFQGFNNQLLQLSKGIDVYKPTYKNDGRCDKPVKNIILLIGDGTGLAQLQAGATVNNANYWKNNGLSIFNMKYIGLQNTSAKDAYTTDSAAGGSALATGELHNNRHISMSEDGIPYPSMTDVAYAAGYACGVVTLGNVADATPAAFYGHSVERDHSDKITSYLLDGKLTLLNGAGMSVFTERNDGRNLLNELKSQYRISTSIDDINADHKKVICIDEKMDLAASGETLSMLAHATNQAIQKLTATNDKGFFLMVEGAKIDYAGHANSLPGSVVETLSFDQAVKVALEFADSNGETLVIVTGDHETGGLALVDGKIENGHLTARYMTDDHTPLMLPVFAYGPCSVDFIGVYKNTQIFHKMKRALGL